ncbi:transketolase family protein [Hippea alviniae]|uniref:transketolase family protein n=1 Tax=Hippea alviniae TaxID=1279027 RepID=UPI0003B740E6|nr:transketolase C-terminal domain-containing protein [Hippea alviniae]
MIPLREAFGKYLLELAERRKDFFVLDADVAGGTFTHWFRDKYPDRFVQCGIAEQNMFGVAAGLSTLGIIPIVSTYAIFASLRAIEQARNSIAYPNFNVKIIASHPGIDVGPDGATHQAIEDLAVYRAIPNFVVLSPADEIELKKCLDFALDYKGSVYMRTGRSPVPNIHEHNYEFRFKEPNVLKDGDGIVIFATGIETHRALKAAEEYNVSVVNVPTLKPVDKYSFAEILKGKKFAITCEDHNIIGGLGSLIDSIVAEFGLPVKVVKIGIMDKFGKSGDPKELAEVFKIDEKAIKTEIKKCLEQL